MLIRDAADADLPAILDIHNDAVLHSTAIWSVHPVDLANRAKKAKQQRADACTHHSAGHHDRSHALAAACALRYANALPICRLPRPSPRANCSWPGY